MYKKLLIAFLLCFTCFITACDSSANSDISSSQSSLEFNLSPTVNNIPSDMSLTSLDEIPSSSSSLDTILGTPNTYDATPTSNSLDSDLADLLRSSLDESTETTEASTPSNPLNKVEQTEEESIPVTTSEAETIAIPQTGLFADDFNNNF